MTIKSLTITEEAYTTLRALKFGDESFSEVILRIGSENVGAAAKFFGVLRDKPQEVEEMRHRIKEHRARVEKDFAERQKKIRRRLT